MRSLRRQVLDIQPIAARAEVWSAIEAARQGEKVPQERWMSLTPPEQGRVSSERPTFNAGIKRDAERRMGAVDGWPAEVRVVANELGFAVVDAFYRAGITKANTIRHLVMLARNQQPDGSPAAYGNHRVGSRK